MDFHQLVKHSIANINDELSKILTLTTLFDSKPSEAQSAFYKRIVQEFNSKIHKIKSENTRLNQKNKVLADKVKLLESQLLYFQSKTDLLPLKARPSKSDGALRSEQDRESTDIFKLDKALDYQKPNLEILSSPIKGSEQDSAKRSLRKQEDADTKNDITSSQFNRLATQYSDASSQPEAVQFEAPKLRVLNSSLMKCHGSGKEAEHAQLQSSSPFKRLKGNDRESFEQSFKGSFASDDESEEGEITGLNRIVSDSQDEFEPLGNAGWSPSKKGNSTLGTRSSAQSKPKYPSHYTALQRVEFLRNYLRPKVADKNFTIDFSKNPITEKQWVPEDFTPNEKWRPPKNINPNLGVMTKAKEKMYDEFFEKAGLGRRSAGPAWDSDDEPGLAVEGAEWVRSQVMDKYLSPPGFMVGDFANTQEVEERKQARIEKDKDRIKRRFKSAISGGEFLFYEPVFNEFVKTGKYVNGP
ncbi:SAE2-domain-containing protein [Metschnikowia bicuspidata var. bicuspidata NRRL YB-4993]|uniref:SAE2-domain-containing protein n=1 Tax=Metschnikowia bicuspidata var. bicuspidata NRRL YB-4993 TaxID=869754 RepID=A0A1A0HFD1_9ASCO|nr:SAE2-domain-containing protein [Metschnikowia bicuspidata var. bicuspidata NRRL YB-4993]OBA22854.1 SAE2-domain-containing protein [Metschnikowia bicuspidata var. bicuspidata NRRL YB-4993]